MFGRQPSKIVRRTAVTQPQNMPKAPGCPIWLVRGRDQCVLDSDLMLTLK